jgi:MerR family transcriptional regulator, light-induced transcriptional regulator
MLATDRTWISIGALARASGIPVGTLRNWERRYGFPLPSRKPSGHRLYPVDDIPRLRRLGELVGQGHRVGDLIHASEGDINRLADDAPPRVAPAADPSIDPSSERDAALEAARALNGTELSRQLLLAWARLGPIGFLDRFLGPLLREVGHAWESGRMRIHHEHFLTARIGDLLRTVRLPLDDRACGPLIILATLPGEEHDLGLEMAALTVASAGWRCRYLGIQVPEEEIVAAAGLDARAVGLSVSRFNGGTASSDRVRRLRALLPAEISLLVGGDGASQEPGVQTFSDFATLADWADANLIAHPIAR